MPIRYKGAAGALLVLLVLFALGGAWRTAQRRPGLDFYQFWVVGQAIDQPDVVDVYSRKGRESIGSEFLSRARVAGSAGQLRVAERRAVLETYSTPMLYAVFRLASSGDYERDLRRFRLLSFAAMLFGVIALCRLLGYPAMATAAALVVFTVWFEPFVSDLRVGNVNCLQLGWLALLSWQQSRWRTPVHDGIGGAILGLGVLFKPNLVFVAGLLFLFWAINRRFSKVLRAAVGFLIAAFAAMLLSGLAFGTLRGWADWLDAVRRMPDDATRLESGNFAFSRLVGEWTGLDLALPVGFVCVASAISLVWIAGRARPGAAPREGEEVTLVALGCLVMLLSSPLAWLHYYVLAVPAALVALRPTDGRGWLQSRLLPAAAILGLAVDPIANLTGLGRPQNVRLYALFVCTGAVILLALVGFELLRRGDEPDPAGSC